MNRNLLIGIVLVVAASLLAWWWSRDGCAVRSDDELVATLLNRCGTALRLERELRSRSSSPSIQRLLDVLAERSERVDDTGARWDAEGIERLLRPDDHVADEALRTAIETIWHPQYVDELVEARMDAAEVIQFLPDPDRIAATLRVLAEPREPLALRRAIAEALASSTDTEVVAALEAHWYSDPNRLQVGGAEPVVQGASLAMRRKAVEQWQRDPSDTATQSLLDALKDPDSEVRASAAFALRGREGPGITEALVGLIDPDEDYTVIYKALAAIEGCPNYDFLYALLDTYEGAESMRNLIVPALARCDDPRIVGPIVDSLDQRSSALGLAAANALATLAHRQHTRTIPPLYEALDRDALATEDKAEIRRALASF